MLYIQPLAKIHSNMGPTDFQCVRTYVVETFLGRFSLNFTSLTYQFISHINPDIFEKRQAVSAWFFLNMLRNHLRILGYVSYVINVSSNSARLLRVGTFSWIVTRQSHQKTSQFPSLVAAHQAEARGPPVGRGPQVENRCPRGTRTTG